MRDPLEIAYGKGAAAFRRGVPKWRNPCTCQEMADSWLNGYKTASAESRVIAPKKSRQAARIAGKASAARAA